MMTDAACNRGDRHGVREGRKILEETDTMGMTEDGTEQIHGWRRAVLVVAIPCAILAVCALASPCLIHLSLMIPSPLLIGESWHELGLGGMPPQRTVLLFRLCCLSMVAVTALTALLGRPTGAQPLAEPATLGTRNRTGRVLLVIAYAGVLLLGALCLLTRVMVGCVTVISGPDYIVPNFQRSTVGQGVELLAFALLTLPVAILTLCSPRVPSAPARPPFLPTPVRWTVCWGFIVLLCVHFLGCWEHETILLHSIARLLGGEKGVVSLSRLSAARVQWFYRIGVAALLTLSTMALLSRSRQRVPSRTAGIATWLFWASCGILLTPCLAFFLSPQVDRNAFPDLWPQFYQGALGCVTAVLLFGTACAIRQAGAGVNRL
jgi:hypothetical protein